MPKTTQFDQHRQIAASEAREQLRGAPEPRSIRDLWGLVKKIAAILGVEE